MDNIKKDKFIEIYARDEIKGNVSMSCAGVNISRQTYYNWLENDKKFRKIIANLKLKLCDDMEQILIKRAVEKSDTALIYWLKYNHQQYKERTSIPSVKGNINIQVINYSKRKGRPKVLKEQTITSIDSSNE